MRLMKKLQVLFMVMCLSSVGMFSGCLTDIAGWDLSACDSELDVCFELFLDNQEKILGGESVIDTIIGKL